VALASLLALALVLAACGSETPPPEPTAADEETATQEEQPPTSAPAPDEPPTEEAAPTEEEDDADIDTDDTVGLDSDVPLPDGFLMRQFATDLGEVRKMVFDDEGVLYVTIMERTRPGEGRVVALPDHDGDGTADEVVVTLDNIDRPHGLAFHEGSLYVSDPARIYRIIDENDDMVADSTEVIVDGMPAEQDHWSRPFVFEPDGNILVIIGSSCNATCTETDERRAALVRYAPDGTQLDIVARGMRSVVDLAWQPGTDNLWAVNNGRDWLGPDQPPDSAFIIREGAHYGWPYCFSDGTVDEEVAERNSPSPPGNMSSEEFCANEMTVAEMNLPPHVAPLGVTFYEAEQFPEAWQGRMVMAWHGAFDFSNTNGYRVVSVPFEGGTPGEPETFINWLMPDESGWFGRPVGVTVGPEGSLYISDDVNGDILRVDYVGE
jgi:glucose/arabinose dehydrogenase